MSDSSQSIFNRKIRDASRRSADDAAYLLWSERLSLDALEGLAPHVNPGASSDLKEMMAEVIDCLRREEANAEHGPTFRRLKQAHPDAADEELRRAIRAAVVVERECWRRFSDSKASYWEDVDEAVERARQENPQFKFSEATYELVKNQMMLALK